MSVLCAGGTHVFQLNSPTCDCGLFGAATGSANPYPLYYPHGYNPFGPPRSPTPPTAGADGACDVPLSRLKAAQLIQDATHLSSDGQRVFIQRLGSVRVCYWDEKSNRFDSSFPCDGLPDDAVAM